MTNVGSSWLSREILSGVSFAVVGFAFALMQWRKMFSFGVRTVVALVAAAIGLVLVLSMSMVYMIPTRPSWDLITTPLSFFVTTFLLGVLAMSAAFVANYAYVQRKNPGCVDDQCVLLRDSLRWLECCSKALRSRGSGRGQARSP